MCHAIQVWSYWRPVIWRWPVIQTSLNYASQCHLQASWRATMPMPDSRFPFSMEPKRWRSMYPETEWRLWQSNNGSKISRNNDLIWIARRFDSFVSFFCQAGVPPCLSPVLTSLIRVACGTPCSHWSHRDMFVDQGVAATVVEMMAFGLAWWDPTGAHISFITLLFTHPHRPYTSFLDHHVGTATMSYHCMFPLNAPHRETFHFSRRMDRGGGGDSHAAPRSSESTINGTRRFAVECWHPFWMV
jgi:hypothetical protein